MCAGDPSWDEVGAREAVIRNPHVARQMGLDEDIPPEFPGHNVPDVGVLRRFPTTYVTPYVRQMLRFHAAKGAGQQLRNLPVLHWPPRFLMALEAIDAAQALRRSRGN